ncbi:flagellar hook-associated protein FlgL [uncultured Desulfuromusa sp.]|uniref:flagellar hook-associated protein FlgL n=1 Tax=uncultured Desulfuromusa sp. TaxID=219183 RepID=UPI002AA7C3FB|nr:flagellar hook-associated protein FlgL [uncultured Desulfuromusa sp.]
MKVTQMATYRTLKNQLNINTSSLNRLYEQALTGKQVNKPSDNPSAISPILNSDEEIEKANCYLETIGSTQDNLDILDGYLDSAETLFVRVKEIAISGINSSMSNEDMQTLADEVSHLQEQLTDIANAQVDGKYLFAGYAEDTLPFSGDPVTYNGTSDHKMVEIGSGQTIQTNLAGNELFMNPVDVFATLSNLEAALSSGDPSLVEAQMTPLDQAAEQVRSGRTEMGNNNAYLDDVASLTEEIKLQMSERLSNYEGADYVEILTNITLAEQSYEAALDISARLSKLSILDYM